MKVDVSTCSLRVPALMRRGVGTGARVGLAALLVCSLSACGGGGGGAQPAGGGSGPSQLDSSDSVAGGPAPVGTGTSGHLPPVGIQVDRTLY